MTNVLAFLVLASGTPAAVPGIQIPVNTSQSYIDVTISAQGASDFDSSPISGYMVIELDSRVSPTQIALQNFDGLATQNMEWHLCFGFACLLGTLDAFGNGLGLYHADPGPGRFWALDGSGNFNVPDIPNYKRGNVNYQANGLACTALQAGGHPCSDNRNLANEPLGFITVPGHVEVSGGMVHVSATFEVYLVIDGSDPNNGLVDGFAYLEGSAPIPLPCDYDDDGDVDLTDFSHVQLCLSGQSVPQNDAACADARLDLDSDVDGNDIEIIAGCLSGQGIPADPDCVLLANQ